MVQVCQNKRSKSGPNQVSNGTLDPNSKKSQLCGLPLELQEMLLDPLAVNYDDQCSALSPGKGVPSNGGGGRGAKAPAAKTTFLSKKGDETSPSKGGMPVKMKLPPELRWIFVQRQNRKTRKHEAVSLTNLGTMEVVKGSVKNTI